MSKLRRGVLLLCTALCLVGGSGRESRAAKVDFLWIIDNSPSMAGEQSVLSAAADDIANQLANARCPIDWRMAVAYTDLHLQPGANDVCPGAPGPGRRRLCPFTTDLNVFRNGTPQCAYVKAGTCGDASERGFNGARVAIDRLLAGTGCEPVPGGDCTLRPDAQLAVIFMTDTGDQTTDTETPPGEPDNSVPSWVSYFSDYDLLRPAAQRSLVDGIVCPLRPTVDNPAPCSDRLEDPVLFDRYSQVIAGMGGTEGSIRNDDMMQLNDSITRIVDAAIVGACCGNGIVDPGEDCDDGNQLNGDCCSSNCKFEPPTTVCRPAAGPCDVAELCTGTSGQCPADTLKPSTFKCRPAAGPCDAAERCTGTDAACPADAKKTSDVCRPAAGPCDVEERCDGTRDDCPADAFQPATVTCRDAAGVCDAPELCAGSSAGCPADAKKTEVCRPAAGQCDAPERCDGASNDCPSDRPSPNGTPCDDGNACTQTDTCQAGVCTGASPVRCSAPDQCHDAGTCDPATGACSNPAKADGTGCSDGIACTWGDVCQAGACTGAPATCVPPDECHLAACNPRTGACSTSLAPDGTPCTGGACFKGRCDSPPDCSHAWVSPAELWPPNHKYVTVGVRGMTDPDGDAMRVVITGIRQDEPLNGLGDGDTCPDASGIGKGNTAQVRAERAGTRDGRVYYVSFSADDGRGGRCQGTAKVCVPHDQSPGHTCGDQGPLVDSAGSCR